MTNNESGRSMVEMLGVLAIIGVLSVMGIAGYTQAMRKYHTNEAAQEITMAAMLCATTGNTSGLTLKYATGTSCNASRIFSWTGVSGGAEAAGVQGLFANKEGYAENGNGGSFTLVS